jgi:hypothetical protein
MIAPSADQADFSTFHGPAEGAESIVLASGMADGAGGVARRMFVCQRRRRATAPVAADITLSAAPHDHGHGPGRGCGC